METTTMMGYMGDYRVYIGVTTPCPDTVSISAFPKQYVLSIYLAKNKILNTMLPLASVAFILI